MEILTRGFFKSQDCPNLKQKEYASVYYSESTISLIPLFFHGPLKASCHVSCTFWKSFFKQFFSDLGKLTTSQFTLQASHVPPIDPSHHQPANQSWASPLAVPGVSGRAPAAWRSMELGMGEWEGEMGEWKAGMEMATYPSGPSMIPCASINRLTAITTTLEAP